jgi:hypothetical protein
VPAHSCCCCCCPGRLQKQLQKQLLLLLLSQLLVLEGTAKLKLLLAAGSCGSAAQSWDLWPLLATQQQQLHSAPQKRKLLAAGKVGELLIMGRFCCVSVISTLLHSRACLASHLPSAWCWGQLVRTAGGLLLS